MGELLPGHGCCWMSIQLLPCPLFLPAQPSPQSRESHLLVFPSSFAVSHGHVTSSSQWNPRYYLLGGVGGEGAILEVVPELVKEMCWTRGFLACFIVGCRIHLQLLGNMAAIFSQ